MSDMVDPPASSPPGIQTYLVNAPHGGLIARVGVGLLIQGILQDDPTVQGSTHRSLLARLVEASARPWEAPSLPLALDPSGSCRS